MSTASDVLLWAQRIRGRKGAAPHKLLEIKPNSTLEDAQEAFHKIARVAHPDLHRNNLSAEELELVTSAYAAVAGAYQAFRAQATEDNERRNPEMPSTQRIPLTPSGPAPGAGAAGSMTPKALVYYRKAELALRRGDLRSAVLQLKMAIATDPQSPLLRSALAEVQAEIEKTR